MSEEPHRSNGTHALTINHASNHKKKDKGDKGKARRRSNEISANIKEYVDPIKYPQVSAYEKMQNRRNINFSLSPSQKTMYNNLLELCAKKLSTDLPDAQLHEYERMWLTEECILRYLRATNWHLDHSYRRIVSTLKWRRSYKVWDLDPKDFSEENETGKILLFGFDNHGRPCIYMRPSRQNTSDLDNQTRNVVLWLEAAIDAMPAGVEKLSLFVDFTIATKGGIPSLSQARHVLHILQDHYCERLGRAVCINLPWFAWGFFKLISAFIDSVTREKLKLNEQASHYADLKQLDYEFGGEVLYKYTFPQSYLSTMSWCEESKKSMIERYQTLKETQGTEGIGVSEYELRGGDSYWEQVASS